MKTTLLRTPQTLTQSLLHPSTRRVFRALSRLSATAILVFLARGAFAQSNLSGSDPSSSPGTEDNWYFLVSTGVAKSNYDGKIQERIDAQKVAGGESPAAGVFDVPGIYKRVGPGASIGLIFNATLEHVAGKWRENNGFAVHTYNVGTSGMYFLKRTTGLGWFIRGDLGYSRILQIRQMGDLYDRLNQDALYLLGAIGHGWQASENAHVLVHLSGQRAIGPEHQVGALAANIGFLF